MKVKMKKIIKYVIIFLVFLYSILIPYNIFFGDSIANLGFSYAITKGEIPYNDFNMIIPPFSPFFYSIPLLIYNSSISFYIFQAILLTAFFYLLEKQLDKKIYLLALPIFFSFPISLISFLFPGYNFLLYLLIFLILYLEKNQKSDLLIGILIGLSIITKHTIGFFLILPSLIFYYKDYQKLSKRFAGILIPITIFFLYLLLTNSFMNFLNLCIFGIFDFASSNTSNSNLYLLLVAIICLGYIIYCIIKDYKNITYYYLLITILYIYPLLDQYHISYFIISTLYIFFLRTNVKKVPIIPTLSILITIIGAWTYFTFHYGTFHFVNYQNYPLRYMADSWEKNYNQLEEFIMENDKDVVLFLLGTENYFYKITHNEKITYFDLPNYGNYGYDGYHTMKEKIDNLHDVYIIIDIAGYQNIGKNQQYYKELVKYICDIGKYQKNINQYFIYYKE